MAKNNEERNNYVIKFSDKEALNILVGSNMAYAASRTGVTYSYVGSTNTVDVSSIAGEPDGRVLRRWAISVRDNPAAPVSSGLLCVFDSANNTDAQNRFATLSLATFSEHPIYEVPKNSYRTIIHPNGVTRIDFKAIDTAGVVDVHIEMS